MPYVVRDDNNQIIAIYNEARDGASEKLDPNDPAVLTFLFGGPSGSLEESEKVLNNLQDIRLTDLGMVRVIEDLIEVLIAKKIIAITDLPEAAITRLNTRQTIRNRLNSIGEILQDDIESE